MNKIIYFFEFGDKSVKYKKKKKFTIFVFSKLMSNN